MRPQDTNLVVTGSEKRYHLQGKAPQGGCSEKGFKQAANHVSGPRVQLKSGGLYLVAHLPPEHNFKKLSSPLASPNQSTHWAHVLAEPLGLLCMRSTVDTYVEFFVSFIFGLLAHSQVFKFKVECCTWGQLKRSRQEAVKVRDMATLNPLPTSPVFVIYTFVLISLLPSACPKVKDCLSTASALLRFKCMSGGITWWPIEELAWPGLARGLLRKGCREAGASHPRFGISGMCRTWGEPLYG